MSSQTSHYTVRASIRHFEAATLARLAGYPQWWTDRCLASPSGGFEFRVFVAATYIALGALAILSAVEFLLMVFAWYTIVLVIGVPVWLYGYLVDRPLPHCPDATRYCIILDSASPGKQVNVKYTMFQALDHLSNELPVLVLVRHRRDLEQYSSAVRSYAKKRSETLRATVVPGFMRPSDNDGGLAAVAPTRFDGFREAELLEVSRVRARAKVADALVKV